MEDQDHLRFRPGFQSKGEHGALNGDCGDRKEIIAVNWRVFRIEEVRGQKKREHEAAEQARPSLLYAKQQKFIQPKAPPGTWIEPFEAEANSSET